MAAGNAIRNGMMGMAKRLGEDYHAFFQSDYADHRLGIIIELVREVIGTVIESNQGKGA